MAVIIGNNVGLHNEKPLNYAEHDAMRFHSLITEIGGVEKERAYLVLGGNDKDVLSAVDEAKGRIHELSRIGPTALIVYVSAHADEQYLHLEGTTLSIETLRGRIGQTPAALRLLIVDACRTPVRAQSKGGRRGPEFPVSFVRSEKLKGDLFIRSTSRGEPAQEWTFLKGALFTHHLITGLRGAADIDNNGRISLFESYTYAFRHTLSGAVTAKSGAQHPSFDYHMEGYGDWTFTTPGQQRTAIVLGLGLGGTIWVVDQKNEIVAEVTKLERTQVRIALKAGWYRVIVPKKHMAGVIDVNLAYGKERTVEKTDLLSMRLRDVVERGNRPVILRPLFLSARYYFTNGTVDGMTGLHLAALSAELSVLKWSVGLIISAGRDRFNAVRARITHIEGALHLKGGREIILPHLTLWFGILGGFARVWQNYAYFDQSMIEDTGFSTTGWRKAWLPSIGGYLSIGVPLTERLWFILDGSSSAKWVPMAESKTVLRYDGRVGAGIGWRI